MYRALHRLAACLLLCLTLFGGSLVAGCGYKFRPAGDPLGITIESLAIPLIESPSSEPGFEADFTRIIREEFISHARLPLAAADRAQALLSGRIVAIETDPLTYDYQDTAVKGYTTTYEVTKTRRMKIRLDVKLTDRTSGRVLWHETAMEEKASFAVGTDPLRNSYEQRQALEKIARRLAKRIYLKTMERF